MQALPWRNAHASLRQRDGGTATVHPQLTPPGAEMKLVYAFLMRISLGAAPERRQRLAARASASGSALA